MSGALDNLTANILANTLTTLQQNALAQALVAISPTFPTPDETSDGIPVPEEALAREWMAALYAIQAGAGVLPPTVPVTQVTGTAPIVVTPTAGAPVVSLTPPARAFGVSGALTLNAGAQIAASATLTPTVSGKLKVRISGVVSNADTSAAQHPITLSVADNAASPALETQAVQRSTQAGASPSTTHIGLVVDLDHASTPTTFPVGTPVTINAVLVGDGTGELSIAAGGVQIEVEEAFA
jgi:hypothetical protein